MEQSESIGKLAEALSKVQAVLEGAKQDSANPFFKSKYADLTSVWAACRVPLAENGLSVIQTCSSDSPEIVIVETMLAHSSGEWVRGKVAMKPVKNDPQGVGSCITYARRYSLAAIVGVAPEDDDGNAASHSKTVGKIPIPNDVTQGEDVPQAVEDKPRPVSPAQKKVLAGLMQEHGLSVEEQKAFYGYVAPKDYAAAQAFIENFTSYHKTFTNRLNEIEG